MFDPIALLNLVWPLRVGNVMDFAVGSFILYVAGIYLLRARGFTGMAAVLPALWLTFAGYGFTLISAGHKGIFHMLPMAVFMFGFLARAVRDRSPFNFAMAGLCVVWGMAPQPDVMAIFVVLGALYGIMLVIEYWPKVEPFGFVRQIVTGGILAAAVVAVLSFSIWHQGQSMLSQRGSEMGATDEQKWVFASNWSMPPEEMIEFLAPCVFGEQTGDPERPYWGRLGQSYQWMETHSGFRNFRQHTVYLGAIPLLLAAYGVFMLLRRTGRPDNECPAAREIRWEVAFWLTIGLLALTLALGRHLPVFRLFHALPLFSSIRAPVKFMHVVDVSLAVLFASGLQQFLSAKSAVLPSRASNAGLPLHTTCQQGGYSRINLAFLIVSVILALCAWVAYLTLPGFEPALMSYWEKLGMSREANLLLPNMRVAIAHAAVLLTVCAALFAWKFRLGSNHRSRHIVTAAMIVTILADIGVVCSPFLKVRSLDAYYGHNVLAQSVVSDPNRSRLSYRVSPLQSGDPLWLNLAAHGVEILEPVPNFSFDSDLSAYFSALARDPLRLWQVTSTGFILGPTKTLSPLLGDGRISVASYASFGSRGFEPVDRAAEFVLLRYKAALPRAGIYYDWETVSEDALPRRLADPSWDPARTVLVSGNGPSHSTGRPSVPVTISRYRSNRIEIALTAAAEGLLLLNDRYDPEWNVTLDGRKTELLRCNSMMRGVRIPPGEHGVVFSYHPHRTEFLAALSIPLVLMVWGIKRRWLCNEPAATA